MGKLYDRKDLEYELNLVDRAEQEAQRKLTPFMLAKLDGKGITETRTIQHGKDTGLIHTVNVSWDSLRKSCRMKLLKTGQLMSDWNYCLGQFNGCPRCHYDAQGKRKACPQHAGMLRIAGMRLKEAADANEQLRREQGRTWGDDEDTHDGSCNNLEQWYFKDRREEVWPGKTTDARQYNLEQFGSLDYKGWLQMMRYDAEEITEQQYRMELARLQGE